MISKKALVIAFVLANFKVMPLVFHFRFWYYVAKNFYFCRNRKRPDLFAPTVMTTMTTFLEMDFNLHKSNSTYFTDMDVSRSDLLTLMLRKFYLSFSDRDLPKLRRGSWIYSPLGSTNMVFRKEITPYTLYNVESRFLGWTQKWLFVLSVFKSHKDGCVYAYGLSKYVLKQHRKTISPEVAFRYEGLLTEEAIARNEKAQKYLNSSLEFEEIIKLIE